MQEPKINGEATEDELKIKRNLLFEEFLANPTNTRLVNEIRLIDDQIAGRFHLDGRLSENVD